MKANSTAASFFSNNRNARVSRQEAQTNNLSALKKFASDQLTLISQNEHRSQMQDLIAMDERQPPIREANYEYLDSNMRPKKAKSQTGYSSRLNKNVVKKPDGSQRHSVVNDLKSQKQRLQDQLSAARSGFHQNHSLTPNENFRREFSEDLNKSRPYAINVQKQQFARAIRDKFRKEIKNAYRSTESAYAAFDFTGLGYITEEAFLNHQLVVGRIPYSKEEIQTFFRNYNLFSANKPGMDFDSFKKFFFPQHYLVQEEPDDADERAALRVRRELVQNKDKQPRVIEDRLIVLEQRLKTKFSNCFESVRKAFLALDGDYDGYVTVEDVLKYFATETDLSFNDLKKLFVDKDSKGEGRLGYMDFSKWLGNAIHMSEGFYFRHDSIKNPQYDRYLKQADEHKNDDILKAQQALMEGDLHHLELKILEKIQFQWKTLRKAFMDLNIEKTGKISRREFKFYLNFWGMNVSENEFDHVFNRFDLDSDGLISYKDFQLSIGSEMFPQEGLYFRQDKPQQCRINSCHHEECWQPTKNNQNFCVLHQKMHQDQAIQIFTQLFKKIGKKWTEFIDELKTAADAEDQSQIAFSEFLRVCERFGAKIKSKSEQDYLLEAFPGMESATDPRARLNIARIFDQKYSILLDKMYKNVDVANFEGLDEPLDVNGYLGKTRYYRTQVKVTPISAKDFISVVFAENKLQDVMRTILEIDQQRNGYVTSTELDDILKLYYPEQLESHDLLPLIKKFSSIQNRILIDYKGFTNWIKLELKKREAVESLKKGKEDSVRRKNKEYVRKVQNIDRDKDLVGVESRLSEYNDIYNTRSAMTDSRRLNSQNISRLGAHEGDRTRNVGDGTFNVYSNHVPHSGRQSGSQSPNQLSSLKQKLNAFKSKRPTTSEFHSRRASRSQNRSRENSVLAARRNSDELHAEVPDGQRTVEANKLVSISDLMKANRNLNQIKIDSLEDEEDPAIAKVKMQYFSNQKQKNADNHPNSKAKVQRAALRESSLSPTIEHDEELVEEHLGRLTKTDGRTYQKILNFVNDANHTWDERLDENAARKVSRAHCKSNADFEPPAGKMYHTLTDQPDFRRTGSKFGATSSVFNQKSKTKFEKLMIHKLAYEWKKIYRNLTTIDTAGTGAVKISDFQRACERNGVSIIPLEIKQLLKHYSVASDPADLEGAGPEQNQEAARELLNYRRLSVGLGIHKDSYNYLNKVQSMNRIQNINKLRQLYQSNERRQQQHANGLEEGDQSVRLAATAAKNYRTAQSTNGLHPVREQPQLTGHGLQDARSSYGLGKNAVQRQKSSMSQQRKALGVMQATSQRGRSLDHRKNLRGQTRGVAASQTLNPSDARPSHQGEVAGQQSYFLNKRNSHNDAEGPDGATQADYIQRLTDQLMGTYSKGASASFARPDRSTATGSQRPDPARPVSQLSSICNLESAPTPVYSKDSQVAKILANKQKLIAFREMVIMHIKKNDLSTKIIASDFEKQSNDIILPLASFKQCLQVVGIHLSPQQLSKFAVRGDVQLRNKFEKPEPASRSLLEDGPGQKGDSRNSRMVRSGNQAIRPKVNALLGEHGPMSLGYNVHKFLSSYL